MTFLTALNESISVGNRMESKRHSFSGLEQIEHALDRLDGKSRSELVLEGQDDTVMIIGGGKDKMFVATIAVRGDEALFDLLRPESKTPPGDESIELVTGGQLGVFDAVQVVDRTTIAQAARAFAQSGQPDPGLRWRRG
jgi:Immunity protein Imm1